VFERVNSGVANGRAWRDLRKTNDEHNTEVNIVMEIVNKTERRIWLRDGASDMAERRGKLKAVLDG